MSRPYTGGGEREKTARRRLGQRSYKRKKKKGKEKIELRTVTETATKETGKKSDGIKKMRCEKNCRGTGT